MGICTAPEIMQLITSTLAGDPAIVKPAYASKAIVDVWIDNILFSGSAMRVDHAVKQFKQRAAEVKATINWNESSEGEHALDFIGMAFNFKDHTIGLAEKNRKKIESMVFERTMSMSDLETNAARLMYGSSVMGVPLSSYYFALKFLRRKLSEINRETLCRDEQVNLPPSVLRSFKNWQNDVMARKRRQLPKLSGKKSFTLWTDASTLGWGAVLIDNDTQQVKVVGARWTEDEAMFHINILEAMAVKKALRAFQGIEGSVIQPRIDNTSVLASVAKGYSKSADLNQEMLEIQTLCKSLGIIFKLPTIGLGTLLASRLVATSERVGQEARSHPFRPSFVPYPRCFQLLVLPSCLPALCVLVCAPARRIFPNILKINKR